MSAYNVVSIAGSDPSGGAGIQADLKSFSAHGVFGMTVVTALTAQSTRGVTGVHGVPASFVTDQMDTLFSDATVHAVKVGMLSTSEVTEAVAAAVDRYELPNLVVDPVMVAKSGDRLLESSAIEALRTELLPRADLITPNLPEAADLLGEAEATDLKQMRDQAERLLELGPRRVLIKGGHLPGEESVDLLVDGVTEPVEFRAGRVDTRNTHGTGCTLSSSIAALLPQRPDTVTAVADAKEYLTRALVRAGEIDAGGGQGPVHHFHLWW
ncbi:hydroxymethylpyrimidine/phosphomethylpyrimidine kinase [Nocardiopsis terrae]|uniref:Hydroxymethylpyrimidine/phosphomethylpyrimidine kinase n=1 Tax=Nocardiopsis terrae TaxID=372655 RepID=A0ABR9HKC3_9ACTN|nr:bifunctional hydroxymethylpyrimidine kinase/phosphomethylpyrimidine kinase [Nocardiopsis terrae]MBE1459454.1 hydroxymethylpyrimidine/phosphomethylpyrimidine kinase [Nocardiopsis terrae]GHC95542.1 hydroxymethylpyrimidine/phosphomethylpyrimidine kinase [Nocardiopsis terrae]